MYVVLMARDLFEIENVPPASRFVFTFCCVSVSMSMCDLRESITLQYKCFHRLGRKMHQLLSPTC